MKKLLTFVLVLLGALPRSGAQEILETLIVDDDIRLLRIADGVYVHVSYADFGEFGRVSSNGLVIMDDSNAILIDTPANNEQTERLVRFLEDSLKTGVELFVPTHWHDDCMGGIDYLHGKGVPSLAYEMTREIAAANGLTVPQKGFSGHFLKIEIKGGVVQLRWPGGGHSLDNIVVWLQEDKILFGGCLVKDLSSTSLGNLSDADVDAWPESISKVIKMFPDARTVVPGHGCVGGPELLEHTLGLLR